MSERIRISAKNLGELALPSFCPRCFWLKLRLNNKLPFQIFPGIFSSIDAYTKNIIHAWFDRHQCSPPWLAELGELTGYVNPPSSSRFLEQWCPAEKGKAVDCHGAGCGAWGVRWRPIAGETGHRVRCEQRRNRRGVTCLAIRLRCRLCLHRGKGTKGVVLIKEPEAHPG